MGGIRTTGGDLRLRGIWLNPTTGEAGIEAIELVDDVWHHWLAIAEKACTEASDARDALVVAHEGGDTHAESNALSAELRSSMTAITADAVAMDAFYAAVKRRVPLPQGLEKAWRKNGTPRAPRVFELLKRSFRLNPASFAKLNEMLRNLYRYRNWAVHPQSEYQAPVSHPVLNVGIEWRFVAFRYENADALTRFTREVFLACLEAPKPDLKDLRRWAAAKKEQVFEVEAA